MMWYSLQSWQVQISSWQLVQDTVYAWPPQS